MEMMGLVIIVVLITTIFLFVLRFSIDTEPESQRKDFIYSELAANTLSAMLKMDSRCDKLSMTELFQECGRDPASVDMDTLCEGADSCDVINLCDHGMEICGSDGVCLKTACNAANETVNALLEDTLYTRGNSYRFFVKSTFPPGSDFMLLTQTFPGDDCDKERKAKIYPIPLHPGTMFLTLQICG